MDDATMARLARQMSFALEIDKLKTVMRQSYLLDTSRKENDAEHSWHLALLAIVLHEYAAESETDLPRVIELVLAHDLVEIDAGDTFLYDQVGYTDKPEREQAAADRIFGLLPADQATYLRGLWEEFEDGQTPEARFARALDRIEPLLLNIHTQGR
ncbi:MAG TPA: HD domain-containing protein, partial [Armatimonadota bacterium]